MKAAWTLFCISLLTASLSFAQSSGTSEYQEKKRGARSTKGTESRKEDTKSQTTRDTLTVSNEIGVGALFFPILKTLEDSNVFSIKFSSGESLRCAVFSPQYVYSDVEGAIQNLTSDPRGGEPLRPFKREPSR
jgi:hypothetical protein